MDVNDVNALVSRAKVLAPVVGALEASENARVQLETAALETVCQVVIPLVRTMGIRPLQREDSESIKRFGFHAVFLAGEADPVQRAYRGDQNRGEYRGVGLWLDEAGQLHRIKYMGEWSRWQGEGDEVTAEETIVSAAETIKKWNFEEILGALLHHVEQAERDLPEKVQASDAIVTRLKAALAVLQGK